MARAYNARLGSAALAAALGLMAGCSMIHDNVKGGFLCQAPKGVCAPSTSIDDAALGQISAEHGADILPASGLDMGVDMARGMARGNHGRSAPMLAAAGRPALRVVHPAWRDSQGRRHERTVDYAYVDAAPASGYEVPAGLHAATGDNARDTSLLSVAERAPELEVAARAPIVAADAIPETMAAADPNAAIRARVAAILANAPKPLVPVLPAVLAPGAISAPAVAPVAATPLRIGSPDAATPSNTGGTFPPAGS